MSLHSVFIIDDDAAVRDSLLMLLRGEGIRARGFASGVDFFKNLPEDATACVITDVRMPDMEGDEVVRRLTQLRGAAWPVIVITGHADVPMVVQMMKAGVVDFIEKPFDDEVLLASIHRVLDQAGKATSADAERRAFADRLDSLSPRERDVVDGLVKGHANKVIAFDLGISPRTVEVYRANAMTKMQAGSLSELVRMVMTAG